jgi:hypothetical protein
MVVSQNKMIKKPLSRYVIVHFISPKAHSFTFARNEWPPHATIVPPFECLISAGLASGLRDFCASQASFPVELGEEARLGLQQSIPARLLVPSPTLDDLHRRLRQFLGQYSAHYVGTDFPFLAHVTIYPDSRLPPHEIMLDRLALVGLHQEIARVRAVYRLGS